MEGQETKPINDVSPEVLEMLTEEERESLEEFNSMGIDINQYANYTSKDDDSDNDTDDEIDEEVIGQDESVNSSDSTNGSSDSGTINNVSSSILTDTDQNFDDIFSDF